MNAISGNYDFNIKAIFSEAWEKTKGFKGTFWAAMGIVLLIAGVGYFIVSDISNVIEGPINSAETGGGFRPLAELFKLILSIFVTTPLGAGLWIIAIRRAADLPVRYQSVFHYFSAWKKLWVYPLVFAVLGSIGQIAIDYPIVGLITALSSLFFAITYFMFIPLVVEKKLAPMVALETSRKTIFPHWFKMLWLVVLFIFVMLGSLITAGIAFIWTMPWMYCIVGILYRNMFGVEKV